MIKQIFFGPMTFAGRIRRGSYITEFLVRIGLCFVTGLWGGISLPASRPLAVVLFGISIWLIAGLPSAIVRRLHDLGRSGAWAWSLLAPRASPYILWLLFLVPGEEGANRYGIDPLTAHQRQEQKQLAQFKNLARGGAVERDPDPTAPPTEDDAELAAVSTRGNASTLWVLVATAAIIALAVVIWAKAPVQPNRQPLAPSSTVLPDSAATTATASAEIARPDNQLASKPQQSAAENEATSKVGRPISEDIQEQSPALQKDGPAGISNAISSPEKAQMFHGPEHEHFARGETWAECVDGQCLKWLFLDKAHAIGFRRTSQDSLDIWHWSGAEFVGVSKGWKFSGDDPVALSLDYAPKRSSHDLAALFALQSFSPTHQYVSTRADGSWSVSVPSELLSAALK